MPKSFLGNLALGIAATGLVQVRKAADYENSGAGGSVGRLVGWMRGCLGAGRFMPLSLQGYFK